MVGGLDDMPGVRPAIDVFAPGQGLVADPEAAGSGAFGHLAQVGGSTGIIIDRIRLDVGTHQHQIGTKRLHDIEFALGAIEIAAPALPQNRGTAGRGRW